MVWMCVSHFNTWLSKNLVILCYLLQRVFSCSSENPLGFKTSKLVLIWAIVKTWEFFVGNCIKIYFKNNSFGLCNVLWQKDGLKALPNLARRAMFKFKKSCDSLRHGLCCQWTVMEEYNILQITNNWRHLFFFNVPVSSYP